MVNRIVLQGRLTYDPELRQTSNGVSVVNFQVAVDRDFVAEGKERQADFIDCSAWRQRADFIAKNFKKGSQIILEGSLQTENYTDKDGNKRKSFTVVADNVYFCGPKTTAPADGTPAQEKFDAPADEKADGPEDFEEIDDDDDDMPF